MPPDEIVLPDNPPNYEGLPTLEQIRLLQEWAPLIAYGQRFLSAGDAYARTIIVGDALEWVAETKTTSKFDDTLVRLVDETLKTPQGEALVRFVAGGGAK
jgi:hypothetical protein